MRTLLLFVKNYESNETVGNNGHNNIENEITNARRFQADEDENIQEERLTDQEKMSLNELKTKIMRQFSPLRLVEMLSFPRGVEGI